MPRWPRTAIATLLAVVPLLTPAAAQDYTDSTRRLQELQQRIERIGETLREERSREQALSEELADVERRLGRQAAELRRLDGALDSQRGRVADLRRSIRDQSAALDRHRTYLSRHVRAAYVAGQQEYLRMLLSQEDPARLDRLLVYYRYLSEARARRIRTAVDELRRLRALRQSLDEELARLEQLRSDQAAQREKLQEARAERAEILARARRQLAARDQELQALRQDERRLLDLVEELRDALADIPEQALERQPFPSRKGELQWPLEGRVAARYGSARESGIQWQGLLIEAPEGSTVRAVSPGRVVFADWLRGLGLLLIIDHGQGYMTLYGHNQSLYKEAGEWVEAGEAVAAVGASGGRSESGLYFEVRAAGRPENPAAWLRKPAGNRG